MHCAGETGIVLDLRVDRQTAQARRRVDDASAFAML
jgi:hypothetical protein